MLKKLKMFKSMRYTITADDRRDRGLNKEVAIAKRSFKKMCPDLTDRNIYH